MTVRCVKSAFVSAAFLAAFATTCGTALANSSSGLTDPVKAGYSALQAGQSDQAIVAFSEAIASNGLQPESLVNVLLNRAVAYQQKGEHAKALEDYTAALGMDVMSTSLRATALHNRGLSQHKLGNLQAAIEDFTSSLLMNPKSAHAFYNRGNVLRENGQFLFALSDYERALRNEYPDKARVYYASATTYIDLKRPNDAKKALQAALLANPDFGQARAQLIMLGDQNAKLKVAEEADPILTGSVAALAGGTLATKPDLPKAVEPPAELHASSNAKLKKKFFDRIPEAEAQQPQQVAFAPEKEKVVSVEEVPAIPAPKAAEEVAAAPETESVEAAAPAVEAAEAASETAAPAGAWTVQVASAGSEDAAWSTWKKMKARYKALSSEDAHVVRADLGKKGVFYRVRLGGYDEQKDAGKACAKLKAKGVNCFISKSGV
jgi:tetratricopeptide (TPR) repeat protein